MLRRCFYLFFLISLYCFIAKKTGSGPLCWGETILVKIKLGLIHWGKYCKILIKHGRLLIRKRKRKYQQMKTYIYLIIFNT